MGSIGDFTVGRKGQPQQPQAQLRPRRRKQQLWQNITSEEAPATPIQQALAEPRQQPHPRQPKRKQKQKQLHHRPIHTRLGKDEAGIEASTLHDENPYPSLRALNAGFRKWRLQDASGRVTLWQVRRDFNPAWLDAMASSTGPTDEIMYFRYNRKDADTLDVNELLFLRDVESKQIFQSRILDIGSDVDISKRPTCHLVLSRPTLM